VPLFRANSSRDWRWHADGVTHKSGRSQGMVGNMSVCCPRPCTPCYSNPRLLRVDMHNRARGIPPTHARSRACHEPKGAEPALSQWSCAASASPPTLRGEPSRHIILRRGARGSSPSSHHTQLAPAPCPGCAAGPVMHAGGRSVIRSGPSCRGGGSGRGRS